MKFLKFSKRAKNNTIIIPPQIIQKINLYSGLTENNHIVVFCTQIISNTISTLPLTLYVNDRNGNKKIAGWHNLYKIGKYRTNLNETSSVFYSLIVRDLVEKGNAFIYIVRDKKGQISQLVRVNPDNVKIKLDGLIKSYQIGDRIFTNKEIIHIPNSLGYDGVQGKSVLEYAKNSIVTSNEMTEFLSYVFGNNYYTGTKINLNDSSFKNADIEKIKELMDFFASLVTGVGAGKPIIEFAGIKFEPFEKKVVTDELYRNRDLNDRQIANYFNVPYSLITGENKYNSMEQFNQFFLQTCLRQYTDRISEYFTAYLLDEAEQGAYFFDYDFSELLTTDIKTLSDICINQTKNGIISINEARQKLNYNSLDSNAANTNFITGVGLVRDDVFESWGAKSKQIQQELNKENNND